MISASGVQNALSYDLAQNNLSCCDRVVESIVMVAKAIFFIIGTILEVSFFLITLPLRVCFSIGSGHGAISSSCLLSPSSNDNDPNLINNDNDPDLIDSEEKPQDQIASPTPGTKMQHNRSSLPQKIETSAEEIAVKLGRKVTPERLQSAITELKSLKEKYEKYLKFETTKKDLVKDIFYPDPSSPPTFFGLPPNPGQDAPILASVDDLIELLANCKSKEDFTQLCKLNGEQDFRTIDRLYGYLYYSDPSVQLGLNFSDKIATFNLDDILKNYRSNDPIDEWRNFITSIFQDKDGRRLSVLTLKVNNKKYKFTKDRIFDGLNSILPDTSQRAGLGSQSKQQIRLKELMNILLNLYKQEIESDQTKLHLLDFLDELSDEVSRTNSCIDQINSQLDSKILQRLNCRGDNDNSLQNKIAIIQSKVAILNYTIKIEIIKQLVVKFYRDDYHAVDRERDLVKKISEQFGMNNTISATGARFCEASSEQLENVWQHFVECVVNGFNDASPLKSIILSLTSNETNYSLNTHETRNLIVNVLNDVFKLEGDEVFYSQNQGLIDELTQLASKEPPANQEYDPASHSFTTGHSFSIAGTIWALKELGILVPKK
jgi:hypothetical protein